MGAVTADIALEAQIMAEVRHGPEALIDVNDVRLDRGADRRVLRRERRVQHLGGGGERRRSACRIWVRPGQVSMRGASSGRIARDSRA